MIGLETRRSSWSWWSFFKFELIDDIDMKIREHIEETSIAFFILFSITTLLLLYYYRKETTDAFQKSKKIESNFATFCPFE